MKNIFFAIPLLGLFSCADRSPVSSDTVVATVGDRVLYLSELQTVSTAGLSGPDSAKIIDSYVDVWVKQQLKVREAEKLFMATDNEIQRKVEEYRNSLLSVKLEQTYTDLRADTLFNDDTVEEYYNNNRNDFVLDRYLFRGRLAAVPASYRQIKNVSESIGSQTRLQDFHDLAEKNKFETAEHTGWTESNEFLSLIPVEYRPEAGSLRTGEVKEIKTPLTIYLIYPESILSPGNYVPMDRVTDHIRRILYNSSRQELIRNLEDSLYKAALDQGSLTIYKRDN